MTTDLDTIAMLRDSLERYSADHYSFLQRAPLLQLPGAFSARTWQDFAEFGWLSLRLPEELDGLAGDAVAVGALMEVVGSRLLLEPLLACVVVASGLLLKQGSAAQQAELLPALAEGRLKLVLSHGASHELCHYAEGRLSGSQQAVLHGDIAEQLLVPARDAEGQLRFCLVEASAAGVSRQAFRLVDGRGAANLQFASAPALLLQPQAGAPSAEQALAEVCDEASVALCAEALGVATSLLRITNDYLKVRQQFGKPLAANQALQHRMAELYLLTEEIRALTRAAQQAMQLPVAERARILSGARAYISQAVRHIGNEAIQLHGGVGITEELEVSHYFRRLMVNAALFGDRDEQFLRFVELSLADA